MKKVDPRKISKEMIQVSVITRRNVSIVVCKVKRELGEVPMGLHTQPGGNFRVRVRG